ncbi:MAG: 50S ribosomal protein L10 [Planctomycetes bacterium]|nr:50S ribosomal protein L10 [Planctomycetota bacterium]
MPNVINRKMYSEYEKLFSSLEAAIFLKFEKHTTAQDRELRKQFRKERVELSVVRNRIARLALSSKMSADAAKLIKGPTAIAFGDVERVIAAAKVLDAARKAKSAPGIEVKGGYLQGAALSPDQVKALTGLPGKKELLSMVLGNVTGTAANVPSLAQSALATPARLVAALIDKKEKEGAA